MWLWLVGAVIVLGLISTCGWALQGTTHRADLLRRHDPDSAGAIELVADAWNPATLPMRDRAFDPPSDSPRYRTGI
ncbi:MAG: hypothetical protein QOE53_2125 [Pseudonocardiales bacterium]|jgi:hypothetical protein|nr:hypothetical protein [Pseudonocardiales bacterium]